MYKCSKIQNAASEKRIFGSVGSAEHSSNNQLIKLSHTCTYCHWWCGVSASALAIIACHQPRQPHQAHLVSISRSHHHIEPYVNWLWLFGSLDLKY